jgi:hypothetical protein
MGIAEPQDRRLAGQKGGRSISSPMRFAPRRGDATFPNPGSIPATLLEFFHSNPFLQEEDRVQSEEPNPSLGSNSVFLL